MSRMCTPAEFQDSLGSYPFSSEEAAWSRPTFVHPNGPQSGLYFSLDTSGANASSPRNDQTSRYGWSQAAANCQALTVDPFGIMRVNSWTEPRPIACCALIQLPEPAKSSGITVGILALGMLVRPESQ